MMMSSLSATTGTDTNFLCFIHSSAVKLFFRHLNDTTLMLFTGAGKSGEAEFHRSMGKAG